MVVHTQVNLEEDPTGGFKAKDAMEVQTFDGRTLDNDIHLFMGQFSDAFGDSIDDMAAGVADLGYEGIGAVPWGATGFDFLKAISSDDGPEYTATYLKALNAHGLGISTLGIHLGSQALSSALINKQLVGILPDDVVGSYDRKQLPSMDPKVHEQIRQNAAQHIMNAARGLERIREVAKAEFGAELQQAKYNPTVLTGFTGSMIWHHLAGFPPISEDDIQAGYQDLADRFVPIAKVLASTGNKFALEVHPGEIAYDHLTAKRTAETVDSPYFGFNGDGSHAVGRRWNYVAYLEDMADLILASHIKGAEEGLGDGSGSVYGSHIDFGQQNRYWDFRSLCRGNNDEGKVIYTLADIGFKGAFENEWEDKNIEDMAGARASAYILQGFKQGKEELIMKGLLMYELAENYKKMDFDGGFAAKKQA